MNPFTTGTANRTTFPEGAEMTQPSSTSGTLKTTGGFLTVAALAVGLTVVFWSRLWQGGGLLGGDIYTYYLPQKVFYAERLAAGELALWNPLVGHGYPALAESQTGVLYPFHLVCYRLPDVNMAYNTVQLVHYMLAFVFTWLYVRRLGYSAASAALAGLVFTYGWFPFRISLEWAILTGAWMPAALWCAECFLQSRQWRYAGFLSVVLAIQMLAGHFHLAFITQLMLAVYVPGRLWFARSGIQESGFSKQSKQAGLLPLAVSAGAVLFGFALAAVQLLPSWELKQRSQRANVGRERFDPAYGHIPVWYWSQTVVPWVWYGTGVDLNARLPPDAPATNDVEAHLYFGILPLVLLGGAVLSGRVFRDRCLLLWLLLGIAALLYTTGWFVPVTRHLPGFSYFTGPGRYGIVTTFAVAVIAGAAGDAFAGGMSRGFGRHLLFGGVFLLTVLDLWWVSRQVGNVVIVSSPPVQHLEQSAVRTLVQRDEQPVRLFCRGANLPTLLGVSSTPVYLGIGPEEYFQQNTRMPRPLPFDAPPTEEQIDWLRRAGVTHILSFSRLEGTAWPVKPVWQGKDRVLNHAWGRREALYLYELDGSRGRVSWLKPQHRGTVRVEKHSANVVRVRVESATGGQIVLTELAYPGWRATRNGSPVVTTTVDGMYRSVEVPPGTSEVVWAYRPWSYRLGWMISLVSAGLLGPAGVVRMRITRSAGRTERE